MFRSSILFGWRLGALDARRLEQLAPTTRIATFPSRLPATIKAAKIAMSEERQREFRSRERCRDLRRAGVGRPICQCHADGFF